MENLEFEYGSWKTWNLSMGHGKSRKMTINDFFPRTTKQEIPQTNDHFRIILKTTSRILGHGKQKKVLEKVIESRGIL